MSENRLFLSGEENKYSSAVAIGLIVKYLDQFFFYIISYFGFKFTSSYNSILFGYLRRNIETLWYDTIVYLTCTRFGVVYSARQRLVGLALQVIERGACWTNTRIGLPPKLTTGAIYNQVEAVIGRKARHSLTIGILAYPTCIRRPHLGGCRRNIAMPFGIEKLEWCGRRPFRR